jgi:hypothetical protein
VLKVPKILGEYSYSLSVEQSFLSVAQNPENLKENVINVIMSILKLIKAAIKH